MAPGEKRAGVVGRTPVDHQHRHLDPGPRQAGLQFDGLEYRQPLGRQHDDERGRRGVGEHLAQLREQMAAALQHDPDRLVAVGRGSRLATSQGARTHAFVAAQVAQRGTEPLAARLSSQQSIGPGRHHLRQRHQTRGMARGGGVEDQQVVAGQALLHQLRDALEQRRLVHARRIARQRQVPVDLARQVRGHQLAQCIADLGEVRVDGRGRIDLDRIEPVRQRLRLRADAALPQVAKVVGRVGGHQQHAAPGARLRICQRRGDRGLAHAPLSADEQHPARRGERQQHPT